MLRFIFNFILFGILFYVIYHFFPDAFKLLVSWAEHLYEFLKEVAIKLYSWLSSMLNKVPSTPATPSTPAAPSTPEHAALSWVLKSFIA